MSAREDIAAAVNAVDGITCTSLFSADTSPGTAFVRLDRIEYPPPLRDFGIRFWDVVLVLPQDLAEAEAYVETKVPALVEAVRPQLVVDRVSPQRLDIPGVGVLPVVFISGHREE